MGMMVPRHSFGSVPLQLQLFRDSWDLQDDPERVVSALSASPLLLPPDTLLSSQSGLPASPHFPAFICDDLFA